MARAPRPRGSGARRPDPSVQAHLALSHGTVAWHTLPVTVRDQVVARWIELLRAHVDVSASREDGS